MASTRAEIRSRWYAHPYHWPLHVGAIAIFSLATLAVCLGEISRVTLRPWEAFAVIGFLVFVNGGEYFIHRGPFHHKVGLGFTYHRHTVIHHAYFHHDSMAVESLRDLEWVLLPAWGYPALVLLVAPLVLLLERSAPGLGWLFLLAMTVYYVVYEIAHTVSHLPPSSPLARGALARTVSRHHQVHHDPARMQHWNFNFAIPLWDRLLGTTWHA